MIRATLYDKNKRSTYSNDLCEYQIVPSGQQPQTRYGNVMGPNQTMMLNTVAPDSVDPTRQQ